MAKYTTEKHEYLQHISGLNLEGRKEGNALFNDTLNTFYLRLYGYIGPFFNIYQV